MALVLTIIGIFLLLCISEAWWRTRRPHDEFSRKFIHITVGCVVAFLPYYLPWLQIVLLSLAFIIVVGLSQKFGIFKAIHAVERPTWGEFCFAAAVGILAVLVREPLVFTIAILHMSLADGLAAIVGTSFGKNNSYMAFGHRKSLAGSLTFLATSLILLIVFGTVNMYPVHPAVIVAVALAATGLENIAVKGLDNLFVPLLIAAVLTIVS